VRGSALVGKARREPARAAGGVVGVRQRRVVSFAISDVTSKIVTISIRIVIYGKDSDTF
jgi:hypothetical protein